MTKEKRRQGRPTNHEKRYENVGRPTLMTSEVIAKLEQAFANAFTDDQACIFAGISKNTLYDYIQRKPEFGNRKEELKSRVDIKAKLALIETITRAKNPKLEPDMASVKWWLERKCKDEFSLKTETEHSGKVESNVVYIEKEEKETYENHIDQIVDGD